MAYKIIPVKLGSIILNIKNMTRGFGKPSSIGEQFMGNHIRMKAPHVRSTS